MNATEARDILQALADGVDPHTGEVLPESSPYQHAQVVRALYTAIQQLEGSTERETRVRKLPPKAGKPWTKEEDQELIREFKRGTALGDLAKAHQRTRGAIQARLERHGLVELRRRLGEPT